MDRNVLTMEIVQESQSYWHSRITHEEKASLPAAYRRQSGFDRQELRVELPPTLASSLMRVCKGKDASLFVYAFAAYQLLLYKYTDQEQVTVSVPVLSVNESVSGSFSSVLPVSMKLSGSDSFKSWLGTVGRQLKEDWKHPFANWEEIAKSLGFGHVDELMGSTLFGMSSLHGEDRMKKLLDAESYDLSCDLLREEGGLTLVIQYNGKRFDLPTIRGYMDSYLLLLTQAAADLEQGKDTSLAGMNYIDQMALDAWLEEQNATVAPYDRQALMQDRFEKQALTQPEQIAIRYRGGEISYRELNERANRWAHLLQESGLQAGDHVGILLDRTPEMLVSVLAVLKAGGAYVPMEPTFPKNRIETIIQDVQVAWIMTKSCLESPFQSIYYTCDSLKGVCYMDVETELPGAETMDQTAVRQLWDHLAERASDRVSAGGFQSSYTGEPFTESEVDQYQSYVMKKISPYIHHQASVLEIGCGSGLITFPLAEQAAKVWAMDPSERTLQRNREQEVLIKETHSGQMGTIEWVQGFAHELPDLPPASLDLIVIASTVQFFPGMHYFQHLLDKLQTLLKPDGHIVLADLLDLQQKQDYASSLQAFARANPEQARIKQNLDEELYIHEQQLQDLCLQCGSLRVEASYVRGDAFSNELKYRFDVILKKSQELPSGQSPKLRLFTEWHAAAKSTRSPACPSVAEDTAYVIFTSGSTGKPKGVVVRHRPVTNLLEWAEKTFQFDQADCGLFMTSLCFDLSVFDIFGLLSYGGSLYLAQEDEIRNPEQLLRIIASEPVTFWNSAPAALQQLVPFIEEQQAHMQQAHQHTRLRLVFLSGDWIPLTLPAVMTSAFPNVQFVALGGATEATVWSNYYVVDQVQPEWVSIPYGKPIQNARYYILNSRMEPCPPGIPGELYIGGECLASGYTDPLLSAQRFVFDPFAQKTVSLSTDSSGSSDASMQRKAVQPVMYRTGDLARWRADGNIEFLGRIDHQVKIRGYRVELGEIQAQLMQHAAIQWALVTDREDASGHKVLCAYYIKETSRLDGQELRTYLSEQLPSYMVPAYYVELDKVPVTPNGKLDRKALPDPLADRSASSHYLAPRNEREQQLSVLWQEVLKLEEIGVQDDFFELGGHSLTATTLVSRINQAFGVRLTLRTFFQLATIEDVARWIEEQAEQVQVVQIPRAPEQDHYPLTSAQRRLYVLYELDRNSVGYHMPLMLRMVGKPDIGRLRLAFQQLMDRHAALRTSFNMIDGHPVQQVHSQVSFDIEQIAQTEEDPESVLRSFIRPFNFQQAPLMRVGIRIESEEEALLLLDMHHIISDGVSVQLLVRELLALYEGTALPEPGLQYTDVAVWQQQSEWQESMRGHEDYWLNRFAGELPVLQLPTDMTRPVMQQYEGAHLRRELNPELTNRLHQLAQETGTTMFMLLLAGYAVLLSKYTGQSDVVIGSPIAGRAYPGTDSVVGMFVNTLALRVNPEGDKSPQAFLSEVRQLALEAYEHQDYPFETLVDKLSLERDLSRNPLFDAMFTMHNVERASFDSEVLNVQPLDSSYAVAKVDLHFIAEETETGLHVTAEYAQSLFTVQTMERMMHHFERVLEHMVGRPQEALSTLQLLQDEEAQQVLHHFNDTVKSYPLHLRIHELFEAQVALTPEEPAITSQDQVWTYRELQQRMEQLSNWMLGHGLEAEQRVGLILTRSSELVAGMLAVLKAGGAYVPVDPAFPEERIAYMLEHSEAQMVLTDDPEAVPAQFAGRILNVNMNRDAEEEHAWLALSEAGRARMEAAAGRATALGETDSRADQLAYVIYTSGSTGQPKGVMIEHAAVVNFIHAMRDEIDFVPGQRIAALTTVSFDIFVLETLLALSSGLHVVLFSEAEQQDPELLRARLVQQQIEVLQATPSRLQFMLGEGYEDRLAVEANHPDEASSRGNRDLSGLQTILIGGEALPERLHAQLRETVPAQTALYNVYGPTETTVWSTVKKLGAEEKMTIGRPIGNTQIYIMDEHLQPQPVGVAGELCISGDGLARGYVGQPDLTAERFVIHPFQEGQRLYRTGDRARWLASGELEHMGRMDDQVKLRGYRIELGEIQSKLMQHKALKWVHVMARKDAAGELYLCAYYVREPDGAVVTNRELRNAASEVLPSYMVPSAFVEIASIPITVNGKVDRRALPEPDRTESRAYIAPQTPMEEKLADIWREVLGVARVGREDHFFELGGDSLKVVRTVSLATEQEMDLAYRDLVQHPTFASLSAYKGWDQMLSEEELEEQRLREARRYNLTFQPSEDLPYYFPCYLGALRQKLNYETNSTIPYSYLPIIEGTGLLGYAFPAGESDQRMKFVNYPYGELLGMKKIHEFFRMRAQMLTFETVEEEIAYCRDMLQAGKVPALFSTTYFLKYTQDYKSDPDKWLAYLDAMDEKRKDSGDHSETTGHIYLLVDEREKDMMVYDSNFNYFGGIDKEDFKLSMIGLPAISFVAGHPALHYTPSMTVLDIGWEDFQTFSNAELGLDLLRSYKQMYVESAHLKQKLGELDCEVSLGLGAILSFKDTISMFRHEPAHHATLVRHMEIMANDWKYKFHFLSDFFHHVAQEVPTLALDRLRTATDEAIERMTVMRDALQSAADTRLLLEKYGDQWIEQLQHSYDRLTEAFTELDID
ncbi:amino acid adenylation domain-containing protein [Marinicrinis sediminis]|uniref:Amino acid adenylation domain-containing protein n=1 Tax=Marinicrinis sediminis TaxID=1652465 RepID=A0ABW5R6Y1_9BACL